MNECPTGCGHNCLPSLGQMNVNSVNMNMPYNRNYYRESEPIHRPRGVYIYIYIYFIYFYDICIIILKIIYLFFFFFFFR